MSIAELPTHTHFVQASNVTATHNTPANDLVLANSSGSNLYGPASNLVSLASNSVTNTGGSQAHTNMQPYLTISFCIALQGIFPSPN